MSQSVKIDFVALAPVTAQTPPSAAAKRAGKVKNAQTLVIFVGQDFAVGPATEKLIGADGEALLRRAAAAAKFKGKALTTLEIVAPAGFAADRLLVVGAGPATEEAGKAGKDKEKHEGKGEEASREAAAKADDFVTLGGFVLSQLSHMPQRGEHFVWDEWDFQVAEVDRSRIGRLLVRPHR